jgi:copper chaperone CopZ
MVITAVLALALTFPAFAASKTVKLHVPDMCASNEVQAQAVLEDLSGISSVETDLGDYIATITYDDEVTSVESFKEALSGISLMVESYEEVK